MEHIVLLGDSIFDNQSYVGSDLAVIEHLREMIPADWSATLCAVDGDTTLEIPNQVLKVPKEATYLFVSVGGNDALMYLQLLSDMTKPGPVLLGELSGIADGFHRNYNEAISCICVLKKPTYLCTIYNGNLDPQIASAAKTAVAVFNDRIYSVANEKDLAVIDLRKICDQPNDYANPIEPSGMGGYKIAKAIHEQVIRREKYLKRNYFFALVMIFHTICSSSLIHFTPSSYDMSLLPLCNLINHL